MGQKTSRGGENLASTKYAEAADGAVSGGIFCRPGGTDFAAARRLGLTALHALSLPAACAPETAGEFVAQTVCEILREREGSA